jgi:carbon storage regulator CsrA
MLVLSRRESDRVVFPNLGITIHVTRIEGRTVRLGIQAPRDVPVLRHEIAETWNEWNDYPLGQRPKKLSHALRNRLQSATLGLHVLHRKLEVGDYEDVEKTILRVFRELESMEQEVSKMSREQREPFEGPLRKALLVEDDENESELLAGCLRLCNFEVVTARDGVDALEYLSNHEKPDVVLLDMNMPRMDGPTTISQIRSNPANQHVKVIAVSGLSQSEVGVSSGPQGVDRWFLKPIKPDLLAEEIHRELERVTPSA